MALLSEILLARAAGKEIPSEGSPPAVAAPGPSLSARLGRGDVALKTEDYRFLNPTEGPGASQDLDRICALPRRELPLIDLTPELRINTSCPGCDLCRRGPPTLRLIQSQALQEARDVGGLLAPVSVGFGKAGISLLLPTVLGSQSTVLMIPANLREQLEKRDLPMWARHFRVKTGAIRVVTYSQLSTATSADILERLKPDLIICDEAHAVAHRSASRTKRFLRYFREHPQTRFCAMSGTLTRKSLHDYAHLSELALKEGTPLPIHYPELSAWAQAIDVSDMPSAMGELRRLCKPGETVRQGFQRRLTSTAGVVATRKTAMDDEAACSLIIGEREVAVPSIVEEHLRKLRSSACRPDGEELEDALTLARCARQMSNGFYYRWIWPTCTVCRPNVPCGDYDCVRGFRVDKEWMQARAAWHREMRSFLSHAAKPGMDSPLLLAQAAASGRWEAVSWPDWEKVKHRPMPPKETVWIDPFLVLDAIEWGKKNVGIIWYEHVAVGDELERLSGLPRFGAGKDASTALLAEAETPRTKARTVICGLGHKTGKNLQRTWSRQLLTSTPSGGADLEQLIGRTHRPGQDADEVDLLLYRHTVEQREAFDKAKLDARYVEDSLGQKQKLNYASIIFKERR